MQAATNVASKSSDARNRAWLKNTNRNYSRPLEWRFTLNGFWNKAPLAQRPTRSIFMIVSTGVQYGAAGVGCNARFDWLTRGKGQVRTPEGVKMHSISYCALHKPAAVNQLNGRPTAC